MKDAAAFALLFTLTLPVLPGVAHADAQAAVTTPPDIVRLKSGTMYRCMIEELVADDHVTVVLPSGDRRTFGMENVTYAGAAASAPKIAVGPPAPPPAPPPPTAPPPPGPANGWPLPSYGMGQGGTPVQLAFEADPPGTDFQLKVGQSNFYTSRGGGISEDFQLICTAPCSATLPTGTHKIGLSSGGGVVQPDAPVTITGPGTLHGVYTSRRGVRVGGFVTMIGGDLLGTAVMVAGVAGQGSSQDCTGGVCNSVPNGPNGTLLGVGGAMIGIATLAGLVMVLQWDAATIEFVPGTPSMASLGAHEVVPHPGGVDPRGAGLLVSF